MPMIDNEMLERINMIKDCYGWDMYKDMSNKQMAELIKQGEFKNLMILYDKGYRKEESKI